MHEGLLDPGLAEGDEKDEDEQMDGSHDEEARRHTHEPATPEGEGEREIHHYCNDDEDKDDGQSGCLHQAHHFVDHV